MTTNLSMRTSAYPRINKALGLALVSILATVLLVGSGGFHVSASAPTNFNNVQVFVQTSQDLPYTYTLTAYNTSGYQVAYYQSNFATAAFELPAGTYLFTVQASYGPTNYPCIACVSNPMITAGPMVIANSTTVTNSTGVTVVPILRLQSSNEYGYAIEQITGASSITINTQNATAIPTTQVTVHIAYVNGTAAQGAWVYASVVDDNYYYYGPNIVSGVQTGANGTAVLTMPLAPLLVTSDLSVPITPPQPQSNVTVTIGGQKVNVTLYWQPNSINLEGQTLILPPQNSGTITLQYQPQQYYYPMPYVESSPPGVGTSITETVTASTTMAGQSTAQGRLPPFNPSDVQLATPVKSPIVTTTVAAQGLGEEGLLLVGVVAAVAIVLVALTVVLVTVRGKSKPSIVSA